MHGAHTKDLPAQTFLRVSQTFGTHEKTIYAAVSQHIWPGQQTTADRPADKCKSVGQVNGQQSDKFGKKKKVECPAQIRLSFFPHSVHNLSHISFPIYGYKSINNFFQKHHCICLKYLISI